MKKSRIISVALTLALVLTTVFAGTEGVFADTKEKALSKSTVMNAMDDTTSADMITALNVNNSASSQALSRSYTSSSTATAQIKTTAKGTLMVRLIITGDTYVSLYDAAGNRMSGYSTNLAASTSQTDFRYAYFPLAKAGTYTLKLEAANYGATVNAAFDAYYCPAGKTTALTKGKDYMGSSPDGKYAYYKVTATATGYFTVDFTGGYDDPAAYYVKLANSKKTNLFKGGSGYEYISSSKGYKTRIGVTKGTYYIAVKTADPYYYLNVKFTKVSENSGSTKSKAKALYKGKTKKGIITASQSASSGNWYKITVKKKQKVNIKLYALPGEGASYGGIKFTITGGKYTVGSVTQTLYYNKTESLVSLNTNNTGYLYPGTYYIKVQKYNGGNGYYNIKWL